MSKKIALIGVLCICLTAIAGTDAGALPPSIGGLNFTTVPWNSVYADSIWTGVGNAAGTPSFISVTLTNIDLKLYPSNHGGNTGGEGVPFSLTQSVSGTDVFDNVTKNGKYLSEIVFHDADFTSLVNPLLLQQLLPNPNWTLELNHCDVLHFYATVRAFTNVDSRCENAYNAANCYGAAEEVVHLETDCTLQSNGTTYSCTEFVHWEWSKQHPTYP